MKTWIGFILLGLAIGPAAARTWTVDDDGAECPRPDFTTVGAAVAAAASGDTIRLCPGVYRENVAVTNKSLTFQGDGSARVILDGNPFDSTGMAASRLNAFTLRATNGQSFRCRFLNLTIRRGRYGILAQDTESAGGRAGSNMALEVADCTFVRNGYSGYPYGASAPEAGAGYATFATDGGGVRAEGDDCLVNDSLFEGNDRAVQFDSGRRLQVTNCQIRGNLQPGISLGRRRVAGEAAAVSDVTIRGNTITGNMDVGIRVAGALRATIETNVLSLNWNSGIVALNSETVTIRQNRLSENSAIDTNGRGSFEPEAFGGLAIVDPLGPTVIADNEIRSNFPGMFIHTAGGVRIIKSTAAAVTLTGNTIFANEGDGVLIQGTGAGVRVNANNITNNRGFGINNQTAVLVNAERNWWASANGPRRAAGAADNPEQVDGPLDFQPWAASPVAYPQIVESR